MKIKIELCEDLSETEVTIKCRNVTYEIQRLEKALRDTAKSQIAFLKDNTEFYLDTDSILFFETDDGVVHAHTADDSFRTDRKLYELEDILPQKFVRVSKSAILNVDHVYSVERSLTSASLVMFRNSHKRIYISRSYYKNFKERILSRRSLS